MKQKLKQHTKPKEVTTLKHLIEETLEDDKAKNVVTIDLKGKTDIADFMVIASGNSSRHVSSLAENLLKKVKKAGVAQYSIEGADKGDWVLLDTMDVIVHIFKPEIREHYNLDKMWSIPIPREELE